MKTKKRTTIYKIVNSANAKVYVGSTSNAVNKNNHHQCFLRYGHHHNPGLQADYATFGPESFTFVVIETCRRNQRYKREQYWMDQLRSLDPAYGYNLRTAYPRGTHAQATIDKIRATKSKLVSAYDAAGRLVRTFLSMTQAGKLLGTFHSHISVARKLGTLCKGYRWEYGTAPQI